MNNKLNSFLQAVFSDLDTRWKPLAIITLKEHIIKLEEENKKLKEKLKI